MDMNNEENRKSDKDNDDHHSQDHSNQKAHSEGPSCKSEINLVEDIDCDTNGTALSAAFVTQNQSQEVDESIVECGIVLNTTFQYGNIPPLIVADSHFADKENIGVSSQVIAEVEHPRTSPSCQSEIYLVKDIDFDTNGTALSATAVTQNQSQEVDKSKAEFALNTSFQYDNIPSADESKVEFGNALNTTFQHNHIPSADESKVEFGNALNTTFQHDNIPSTSKVEFGNVLSRTFQHDHIPSADESEVECGNTLNTTIQNDNISSAPKVEFGNVLNTTFQHDNISSAGEPKVEFGNALNTTFQHNNNPPSDEVCYSTDTFACAQLGADIVADTHIADKEDIGVSSQVITKVEQPRTSPSSCKPKIDLVEDIDFDNNRTTVDVTQNKSQEIDDSDVEFGNALSKTSILSNFSGGVEDIPSAEVSADTADSLIANKENIGVSSQVIAELEHPRTSNPLSEISLGGNENTKPSHKSGQDQSSINKTGVSRRSGRSKSLPSAVLNKEGKEIRVLLERCDFQSSNINLQDETNQTGLEVAGSGEKETAAVGVQTDDCQIAKEIQSPRSESCSCIDRSSPVVGSTDHLLATEGSSEPEKGQSSISSQKKICKKDDMGELNGRELQMLVSDLQLQLNASQQDKATLELEIRQKEEIVLKTQVQAQKNEEALKQEIKQLTEKLKEKSKITEEDQIKELQKALKDLKEREAKALAELSARQKEDFKYKKIMEEFETNTTLRLAEFEKFKKEHETAVGHLANLELAFSDVHQKYERSKAIIDAFKAREETMKYNLQCTEDKLRNSEAKYESLKTYAQTQIEKSNKENLSLKEKYEGDNTKLKALIKRIEIENSSLVTRLQQKTEECGALSELCDRLTTGKQL